jgi:RHS repeat-associated protein
MEVDPETKGNGNSYTTEFRQYDPRLGRWLSLDPMAAIEPGWTPYRAFFDNPIVHIDPDGLFEDRKAAREYRKEKRAAGFKCGKILEDESGNFYFWSSKTFGGDTYSTAVMGRPKSTEPSLGFTGNVPTLPNNYGPKTRPLPVKGTLSARSVPLAPLVRILPFLAPLILSGDEPRTRLVYETEHFKVTECKGAVSFSPKPDVKLSPKLKEVLYATNRLASRNQGKKTDVYVARARHTGRFYECKSCITCQGELVELKKNEIYKFGISSNMAQRYSGSEKLHLSTETLLKDVSRDMARAFEKLLILEYCLGGYGNQTGKLEQRGIFTTFGKPIGNPYFR